MEDGCLAVRNGEGDEDGVERNWRRERKVKLEVMSK